MKIQIFDYWKSIAIYKTSIIVRRSCWRRFVESHYYCHYLQVCFFKSVFRTTVGNNLRLRYLQNSYVKFYIQLFRVLRYKMDLKKGTDCPLTENTILFSNAICSPDLVVGRKITVIHVFSGTLLPTSTLVLTLNIRGSTFL